jgi:hypothetical protein
MDYEHRPASPPDDLDGLIAPHDRPHHLDPMDSPGLPGSLTASPRWTETSTRWIRLISRMDCVHGVDGLSASTSSPESFYRMDERIDLMD